MQPGESQPHTRVPAPRNREHPPHRQTPNHVELELVPDEVVLPERSLLLVLGDAFKRAVDLIGALVGLIVLLPVFAIIAVAIKVDSRGAVFFAHRRLGRDGRHFDCLKFRTMHMDAERRVFEDEGLRHQYVTNHFKIPSDQDPRLTRLGRFLRQSSIDELPQLWNVLKGHMSLVGPRPIVALEATHYGDLLPELLSVRPGLTGWWAVSGRSEVGYPERVDVELSYVRSRSLPLDMRILALTPWTVITRRGAV